MKRNKSSGTHIDEWPFVAALRRPVPRIFRFSRLKAGPNEADLSGGVRLDIRFKSALLETAFADFDQFLKEAGIAAGGKYRIVFEKKQTSCFEEFQITIGKNICRLQAADTEGLRRAVFYLEEQLLAADGPFLQLGRIRRKPWLKNRISRCYFGPIKRPPFNRDELMDDVDYYPDEYLNRLVHEGINGLWLTVEWRDLCKTSITPLPPDAPRRLAKLRRTVEKCARYGIKIWIFHIEPAARNKQDPLLKKYPELGGAEQNGKYMFCPTSARAQKYIRDSVYHIFSSVPGLGGIINITHGERATNCMSAVGAWQDGKINCPRCSKIPKWKIIYNTLAAMRAGMRAANPAAELIAWFYMPNARPPSRWVYDVAAHMPKGVIFQYNFESNLRLRQLGKIRAGGDYWLSGIGPSENFRRLARKARAAGAEISGKLQVCCSHEVATVPYVPVPGILYRKYRQLHALGARHVMQCWYFGNYPGLMHRAAGKLAFENFKIPEETFLRRLARPDWGAAAPEAAKAWRWFSDAYVNYPLDNMMQYYGPAHSGAAWPLLLKQGNLPLAPTWMPNFPPSGDAIGECLANHSLDEAITLTDRICRKWARGLKILQGLAARFTKNPDRLADIRLAEALGIHFECARNIMEFYRVRRRLFSGAGNKSECIRRLGKILIAEIVNRSRLARLCALDARLGFHPEAEAYQYDRKKILASIRQINHLLQRGLPALRAAVAAGSLARLAGDRRPVFRAEAGWIKQNTFRWRVSRFNQLLRIEIEALPVADCNASYFHLAFFDRFSSEPMSYVYFDLEGGFHNFRGHKAFKWKARQGPDAVRGEIIIPVADLPWLQRDKSMACAMYRFLIGNTGQTDYDAFPSSSFPGRARMGMCRLSPDQFGIIVFA